VIGAIRPYGVVHKAGWPSLGFLFLNFPHSVENLVTLVMYLLSIDNFASYSRSGISRFRDKQLDASRLAWRSVYECVLFDRIRGFAIAL
jgi:hypothetical protein